MGSDALMALDKPIVSISVLLIGRLPGRTWVLGVRQAGLEITDDRAQNAGREQPWPEGTGHVLSDGRKLS